MTSTCAFRASRRYATSLHAFVPTAALALASALMSIVPRNVLLGKVMKINSPPWGATSVRLLALIAAAVAPAQAQAGQDANFILYNHHMEEKGALEVEVYSDYGHVGNGEPNYTAQLLEFEYGVTGLWTTSLYLEGAKVFEDGGRYDFASFRFENRVRLFKDETLLNPVLYVEYEQKEPESKFHRSIVGRVDTAGGPEETEHEIETKLILGHDFSSRFNVAFNTIQELKLDNGVWSFGYAAGLNYDIFRSFDVQPPAGAAAGAIELEKVTLGLEMFGGAGDTVNGLTLDPDKTEQYAGVNLRADFSNNVHVGVGGAFGLTSSSEDALLRMTAGIEFE